MLQVTRLNGSVFHLNPDLMMTVEANPDTIVTMTNGEKLLIRETPEEMTRQFLVFKQQCYAQPSAKSPPGS